MPKGKKEDKRPAEDVPLGSGLAERAKDRAAERRKRQGSRLDSIMGQIRRQRDAQSTDSNN